jgi:hypothetical protein
MTLTISVSRLWQEDVGCVTVTISVSKPNPAVVGVNTPPAATPLPVHEIALLVGLIKRKEFKLMVPGKKQNEVSLPAFTDGTGLIVTVKEDLTELSHPVIESMELI